LGMYYRNVRNFAKGEINIGIGRGKADLTTVLLAENCRVHSGEVVIRAGQSYLFGTLTDENNNPLTGNIHSVYQYTREYWDANNAQIAFHREYLFSLGTNLYAWVDGESNVWLCNENNPLGSDDIWIAIYQDWAYIADGVGNMWKYDAANFYRVGIEKPTFTSADVTQDASVSSNISGFRRYKYRYVRKVTYSALSKIDYIASPFSDYIDSPDFGLGQILISLKASGDPQVNAIELFCTEVYPHPGELDGKPFYRIHTGTLSNVDQVFTDREADLNLNELDSEGNLTHVPEDTTEDWTNPPDGMSKLVFYKDRIYGVAKDDPSRLRYSNIGQPEQWPANNWLGIREDDGDVITAIAVRGNTLYVFKNRSIYMITGDVASAPMVQVKTGGEVTGQQTEFGLGCTAPRSLASYKADLLVFYSKQYGIYSIEGGNVVHLSQFQENIKGYSDECAGAIYEDDSGEPMYVLSQPSGIARVCHLPTRAWARDTNVNVASFCVDDQGRLIAGLGTRLNHYYDSNAADDNGTTITARLRSAWINLRDANMFAVIRGILIQSANISGTTVLELYNENGLQVTTTFSQSNEAVGISGIAGRLFSVLWQWTTGTIESFTFFFTRRKGH